MLSFIRECSFIKKENKMKRILVVVIILLLVLLSQAKKNETKLAASPEQKDSARREWHTKRFLKNFEIDKDVPEKTRLKFYVENYKRLTVYDPKSTWFDVAAKSSNKGGVILTGEVMFPQHKSGLEDTFKLLGYEKVDNRIKVLPEDSGLGTKEFALVTSYTLRLMADYNEPRSILDEALYGSYARLLKANEQETSYFVQLSNGYVGWVDSAGLKLIDYQMWREWTGSFPKALLLREIETGAIKLPKGCILPVLKREINLVKLKTVGGEEATVSSKDVALIEPKTEKGREEILNLTTELMGLKYKWGGFAPTGYDCSGFSRMLYSLRGINLPRDADQQSAVGEMVAFRGHIDNLLPGDLLFFCTRFGKIGHVAISLGGKRFIHSTEPTVRVNSLDQKSADFSDHYYQVFAFARRILLSGF